MADIGSLVVKIAADASALSKELDKITRNGQDFGERLSAAGKIASTAIIAVTSAAVANTLAIAKQTEETEQMSQKTGISVQTLQRWSVVMAENSVTAQGLTSATLKLSQQIVEARKPASTAAAAFDQLGISITSLGDTEDVIRAVADKFQAMPDGAEKATLAVQLFGKAGLDMIPILNRGAKAFDESKAAAERYGLVLTTTQVAALTATDDAVDNLGQALQGLRTQLAIAFAPSVKTAIDIITASIVSLKDRIIDLKAAMGDTSTQAFLGRAIVEHTQQQVREQEAYEAERGEAETKLGLKMRDRFIRTQIYLKAERNAQEELGKVVNQIAEREKKERNDAFGEQMMQMEALQRLQEGLGEGGHEARGGNFEVAVQHQHEMIRNLETINVSTGDWADQIDIGNEQEAAGLRIVQQSIAAYESRHDMQRLEIELAESAAQEQAVMYQQEANFLDAADNARRAQMRVIDERYALERALIEEMALLEEQKALKIQALDQRTDAQRRQIAQQFPGFWEKQLTALEQSNSFSMALIVNTWSSGIASMIVRGGDLRAAWEQTQIAILQGFINMGVQALASAVKMLIVNEVAAAGVAGVWAGAASFVVGVWGTVTAAMAGMFAALVGIVTAVGTAIMGVLTAIGTALGFTGVGAVWAGAIFAGVALIAASLVALEAVGVFAKGGIVTEPMLGLVGEAGPEAIIPLEKMGDLGGGNDRPILTTINIDGKKMARALTRHTASAWRWEGASA